MTRKPPDVRATVARITASARSIVLLAANAKRKAASVRNVAPGAFLYINIPNLRPICLAYGCLYEVPAGYTGVVEGAWTNLEAPRGQSLPGEALVTELEER